ncbi:MAG: [protein-PII] uridylyltransferase [Rickettsiales bacterium]
MSIKPIPVKAKERLKQKLPSLNETLRELSVSLPDKREHALEICKKWLEEKNNFIKREFLESGKVTVLLSRNTKLIDELLISIFSLISADKEQMAIIAVGGYGRSEMFPYSDVDLLFLYNDGSRKQLSYIAESILYILWDLGFKVGQSHQTIEEALEFAKDDITVRTNMLDSRYVVGNKDIFSSFYARFDKDIVEENISEFIEAKLEEREKRHQHFGDSRYMLEPNVKEGKGGLRDTHTLWWIIKAAYSLSSNQEMVKRGLVSRKEYRDFEHARVFLCRTRAHLHYIAGRMEDRITFDYQHRLAEAMGFSHPLINRTIERFMRRYFVAVRTIGSTTRIFCALLEDSKKRKLRRRRFTNLWRSSWVLGDFTVDGDRLNVRDEDLFKKSPISMIEIFRTAQINDLHIHPKALQLISYELPRIDHELRNDKRSCDLFLDILLSPKRAEGTLRNMSEAGVLGSLIRDFGRIIGQTQFNMYHVYTVDEHTLVAIGILHDIENGKLKKELPLATDVFSRIRLRRVLYLALFCHDIAKGRGGDHSRLGEKVGIRLAKRFGCSPEEVRTVGWLVRYHLLFNKTAIKRDINDPKTVEDFVATVQTPERLKLLLLLTVADIRAVSSVAWNDWKGVLLRELYERADSFMGSGKIELRPQQTDNFRVELCDNLEGWNRQDVDNYLALGDASFLVNFELSRHIAIACMVRKAESIERPILLDIRHNYERSFTEIVLCTNDQKGIFSKVAGAMSLVGANIINAKIFTLKNGIAIESFWIQAAGGVVFDRTGKLDKMSSYIEQSLFGEFDMSEAFNKYTPAYIRSRSKALPIAGQVLFDNEASNLNSLIELTCRDRVGLLYDITRAIAELNLSIVTAHISTYGTQAADVFYVKDNFGFKVTHKDKINLIKEKLLSVING